MDDQATIIWAGIKHNNKNLTVDAVLERLEKHIAEGGSFQDVYLAAMTACCKSKVLGNINEEEVDRILRKLQEGEPGKEEAKS